MTPELTSSVILTLVGMGTVASFLWIMVVIVDIASKFLSRFAHLIEAPATKKAAPAKKADDGEIIAAVAIALQNR